MGPLSRRAADGFRRVRAGACLLCLLAAISSDAARALAQESAGPGVRVGVALDRDRITLKSSGGLRVEDALTGQPAGEVEPGGELLVRAREDRLSLGGDLTDIPQGVPSVRVVSNARGLPVSVDGRTYRGAIELRVAAGGKVSAINELPLEEYLFGVVPLEIGPRSDEERAAVEAQAVAARTYAVAQLGNHAEAGFDVFGTVSDQVYGGIAAERKQSTDAVRRTAGMILMFEGRPIRAYYHSTCGGTTAAIEEVMDREPAPYLQSVSDESPDGSDYCAASPRYRWEATWNPDQLGSATRPGLTARFGSGRVRKCSGIKTGRP